MNKLHANEESLIKLILQEIFHKARHRNLQRNIFFLKAVTCHYQTKQG